MMVYDSAFGKDVLFGGVALNGPQYNDTWTFNGKKWKQQHPASSPPAAYYSSMAYDAALREVVLYTSGSDETWIYNGITWTQEFPADNPGNVVGPSMDYDQALGEIVLVTGPQFVTSTSTLETWTYNGSNWVEQDPIVSPPNSSRFELADDPKLQGLLLYGGLDTADQGLTTTWTYNGATWSQQATESSPPPAIDAPMTFDDVLKKMVLLTGPATTPGPGVTGGSPTQAMKTWVYDGSNWSLLGTNSGPSNREDAVMAEDPRTRGVVLFGGDNNSTNATLGDSWKG